MAQLKGIHRADGVIPVSITLDRDAWELIGEFAPARRAYGRFLSRLVYEHKARVEAREEERRKTLEGVTGRAD